jgi:hypothetical protein
MNSTKRAQHFRLPCEIPTTRKKLTTNARSLREEIDGAGHPALRWCTRLRSVAHTQMEDDNVDLRLSLKAQSRAWCWCSRGLREAAGRPIGQSVWAPALPSTHRVGQDFRIAFSTSSCPWPTKTCVTAMSLNACWATAWCRSPQLKRAFSR